MQIVKMVWLIGFFLALFLPVTAESRAQKVLEASYTDKPVKIDGILSEPVWQKEGYSDFTQSDPIDGAAPTEKTVVHVAFDEKAIYVAAELFDSEPDKIIGLLGRRDDLVDSDWFIFAVDPYYDRRSGFQFGVNPAGSIVDMTLYNDELEDYNWDGVWESAARINDNSWTVEMRIPFHQLRFKKKTEYEWGVNFKRVIKRKNENDVFVWVPKEESGYVSRFDKLVGITKSKQERGKLFEILPFTSGKAAFSPAEEGNPFKTGEDFSVNAGLDIKVGLKSNLTLDLSFNPDFGQVEVDPAVINLTASETYYEEKRPFFIEGSNIFEFGGGGVPYMTTFGWRNPNFFYSRRIGRPPQGSVNSQGYVQYPDWVTILGAAKITGKIGKGWNIGLIGALTQREYADIDLNGERQQVEVEPFSNYGVLRIQKEFNEGRQGLGFITTSIFRNLRTDNLENSLSKSALSLAIDGWTYLNKKKSWVVTGWLGGTEVSGSKEAITGLQQSYLHYYQRPDATHVELDPNATSLKGWAGRLYLAKVGGTFLFNAAIGAVSPGFDTTDAGFQFIQDTVNSHVHLGYVHLHPGKIFRNWHFVVAAARSYDFGWNKTYDLLFFQTAAKLLNYWEGSLSLTYCPDRWSNTLTRGGPLTLNPAYGQIDASISSDNRKSVVLSLSGSYYRGKADDNSWLASLGVRWKPKSNFSLYFGPYYGYDYGVAQWVGAFQDALMTETYGSRYVFSDIHQKTLACTFRINWIFTPKLSLQAYIQPFISVGAYDRFKELARSKSFDFNTYGQGDSTISYGNGIYLIDPDGTGPSPSFSFYNPDFNYKSLRGTVVLRWEYRPGSTFYAVWTQNRADYANPGDFSLGRDLKALFSAEGDNIFMIKFTHRFKL
jgi:hypothetical protein